LMPSGGHSKPIAAMGRQQARIERILRIAESPNFAVGGSVTGFKLLFLFARYNLKN
jgi:hypothetical protein